MLSAQFLKARLARSHLVDNAGLKEMLPLVVSAVFKGKVSSFAFKVNSAGYELIGN